MTPSPKKWMYLITIKNSNDIMVRFGIVASTGKGAEAEARRLAGVDPEAELQTFQKSEPVDSIID